MSTMFRRASEDVPTADEVRERRIEIARRNRHWQEVEEIALVPRGRLLVHADTDEVFSLYRATVFATGSATIDFNENVALWFYVDQAGEVVFLERRLETWSAIVERKASRRR